MQGRWVIFGLLVATGVVALPVVRAEAWVAAYGRRGAVVAGRGGCCYHGYSGGAVAGAAVAGLAVGAVAGAAAASRPPAVVYAPPAVVYAPPPVAVGSVVYALPGACTSVVVNGVNLFHCASGFYQPVYQGGAVAYQLVPGP